MTDGEGSEKVATVVVANPMVGLSYYAQAANNSDILGSGDTIVPGMAGMEGM